MSSRIMKSRSKKGLFSGLSFKQPSKAKPEATPTSGDQQALHVADTCTAGGESSSAAAVASSASAVPIPKQPFVVVSGMASLSGDVPRAGTEGGGDSAQPDGADAPEMEAEGLSAEPDTTKGDTATKAPDTPSAAARAIDLDLVPGEVLRVGVARSRSLSGDDSAATCSVTGGGSAPAKAAGVPGSPLLRDFAADSTAKANGGIAKAPDTSPRGHKKDNNGIVGTKNPSDLAGGVAIKANDSVAKAPGMSSPGDEKFEEGIVGAKDPSKEATIKAPSGKNLYVVISGYAKDNTGSGKAGVAPAGRQAEARPETQADGIGIVGEDAGTPPPLEAKKRPKKGLFGGIFGSSKALSKPEVPGDGAASEARGSPLVSSKCDGSQPVSDLSVDMWGTTPAIDRRVRELGRTAVPLPRKATLKTPSGETNKPNTVQLSGAGFPEDGSSSAKVGTPYSE